MFLGDFTAPSGAASVRNCVDIVSTALLQMTASCKLLTAGNYRMHKASRADFEL